MGLLTLPIAFLWSYPLLGPPNLSPKLQAIARNFSVVALGFLLYISSFRFSFFFSSTYPGNLSRPWLMNEWLYAVPGMIILGLISSQQWLKLFRVLRSRHAAQIHLVILAMLGIVGSYSVLANMQDRPEMVFVLNALLAVLGIGCIRESLETKRRSQFWYGLIVLVVQIASRFLEYDTELILKSIILTLCGVSIIVAGIWFEKYAGRSGDRRNPSPDSSTDSPGDLNP